ncbi:MAG: hypothetical protein ACREF4_22170, partial [Gammaproteobacteria bacterium]
MARRTLADRARRTCRMLLLVVALALGVPSWSAGFDGERFDITTVSGTRFSAWKMVDGATTTTTGSWVDWRGYTQGTLDIAIAGTATVQVFGSNATQIPADATDGNQIGGNITTGRFTTVTGPYRWMKVKVQACTGCTVDALLEAGSSGGGGGGGGGGTQDVNCVSGCGGSGGTASTFGAAVPAAGTAIGVSDGTNMQIPRSHDTDTGAGVQHTLGVNLRLSASGGSVEGGTAANPLRTDPTGVTTQPVAGTGAVVGDSLAVRCVNAANTDFESCGGGGGGSGAAQADRSSFTDGTG